ncbi:protein AF-10 [Trichonephila clavipes]|nr:protein AF-10 [Trichonephila clavipes]
MHLWISFTPNVAVLFVDVAIQPEVRFIAKQNSLMKIGNNGNLVLGPFNESTPCLMIVLMNCQTKLRINHLTAVKSDEQSSTAVYQTISPPFSNPETDSPNNTSVHSVCNNIVFHPNFENALQNTNSSLEEDR